MSELLIDMFTSNVLMVPFESVISMRMDGSSTLCRELGACGGKRKGGKMISSAQVLGNWVIT